LGPGVLSDILRSLPKTFDPNLLVGFDTSDDAAVYRLSEQSALVQTVDFFPPMVDDPRMFGRIAAANALSDIYAMGGIPSLAMNLLCFPSCLGVEVAGEILAGGAEKILEAGAVIAGGHSIEDAEPKYGLCVSGFVDPRHILANAGARPGDVLILTKPIGSGVLTTALKAEMLSSDSEMALYAILEQLNRYAAQAAAPFSPNACTDITGFGLLGHAAEIAAASGVSIELVSSDIPYMDQALAYAEDGLVPGGAYRNRDYFSHRIRFSDHISTAASDLLFDPQTSGGLLLSIPESRAEQALSSLRSAVPVAAIIGYVTEAGESQIIVR